MPSSTDLPVRTHDLLDRHDSMREGPLDPAIRVVDAEIVGHEPQPPLWRRAADRVVRGAVMFAVGLGLIAAGLILTATIIGAVVGIPLAFLGLCLCLVGVLAPFMQGKTRFVVARWPS
jgi:hypothetical protein